MTIVVNDLFQSSRNSAIA